MTMHVNVADPDFNPSGDEIVDHIKRVAQELGDYIQSNVQPGRRRSEALTCLETSAMFAVKAQVAGDK